MGMFSSKKKVEATTTVSPVMDATQIQNPVVNAGIDYALMGDPSLTDSIMRQVSDSLAIKVRRGHKWALTNDYSNGLPKSNLITANAAEPVVDAQLLALYGAHTKVYYHFGPLNLVHYAWWELIQNHGYNPTTNVLDGLTASLATTVYLKDIVPTLRQVTYDAAVENEEEALYDVWGSSPASGITLTNPTGNPGAPVTPYVISSSATDTFVTVYYEYLVGVDITTGSFDLSLSAVEEDEDHHQALVIQTDGTKQYFTYLDNLGTYPSIDAVYNLLEDGGGNFLPWTYFVRNYVNQGKPAAGPYDPSTMFNRGTVVPEDSKAYKDHVKWCNYLGLNYQSLADSMQQNPDMENVVQIALMFGVPTKATTEVEREYLFRYFSALYDLASAGTPYGMVGTSAGPRNMAQVIKDKYAKQVFSFSGIRRTLQTGVVTSLRGYTRLGAGIWAHQINETQYVEVQAYKVNLRNKVLGKYSHDGALDADTCRVPIDVALLSEISIVKKTALISHAMYFSINTYTETEEKWYQSGAFKIILIVAAVICMCIPGLQPAGMALAVAAGATAVAIYILTTIIVSLIIQYAVAYLVDVLGIQNAMLLAVIAVAATVYMSYTGVPAPQGTFGEVLQAASTNLVDIAQQATTSLITTIGEAQQDQMLDLQKDMEQFAQSAKEQKDALQEQIDKYNSEFNQINAMAYVRKAPMWVVGETPQAFYDRTIHTPNPGVLCYSAVANYVSNNLKLPTFDASMKIITDAQGTLSV